MAEKYFDSGIITTAGFSVPGQSPVDKKYTVKTIAERDEHVPKNRAYKGMLVFVEEDQKTYQLRKNDEGNLVWKLFGFDQAEFESQVYAGLDSDSDIIALAASQGKVLDTKITTHTEDAGVHVTAEQKAAWDAKPDTKEDIGLDNVTNDTQVKRSERGVANGVATLDEKGLIPSSQLPSYVDDVVEVDSFDNLPTAGEGGKIYVTTDNNKTYRWGGTGYVEISESIALGETQGTAYEGSKGKALADDVADIKDGTITVGKAANSDKVNGFTVETAVPVGAKFTDTTYNKATTTTDGLMSKEDKSKLDNLNTDDIKVGTGEEQTTLTDRLAAIPATDITQDETHKFVTDEQIQQWTEGAGIENATITTDGLMSKEDKQKLEGIEEGANNYVHPDDENTRHVTDTQIAAWDAKASTAVATTTTDGLMSKEDKSKLDNLNTDDIKVGTGEEQTTLTQKLAEPIKAEDVTTDTTHQFVTQEEKDAWTSGTNVGLASPTKNGLMAKEDKSKLDNINIKDVIVKDIILLAADWVEATRSIDITIQEFVGDSIMNIGPASGIDKNEYNVMSDANLKSVVKQDGVITITYQGIKPTIDLHISALIFIK